MYYIYLKYNIKIPQSSTGKERDSETGFSYFGARYYDSDILTGWLSVDPLADKYPSLSPYNYCALNPIKVIDPNGDSCAILLAGNTLWPVRHIAVLVQKDIGKGQMRWFLYSKNGDDGGEGEDILKRGPSGVKGMSDDEGFGGKDGLGFNSVQDFLTNYRPDDSDEPYYTEAYVLPTTPEQDIKIRETMINELYKKYNLLWSNCAEAVNNSLKAAGINTNDNECIIPFRNSNPYNYIADNIIPRTMYRNIKRVNPNGKIEKP